MSYKKNWTRSIQPFDDYWIQQTDRQKSKSYIYTVKPLLMNASEESIKCRLNNFSMSFILYYVNFSICENK